MLRFLKEAFRRGVRIPFLGLRARIERDYSPPRHPVAHRAILNQARALAEAAPEIADLVHPCLELDQDWAQAFRGFLDDYVPLVRDCARETQKRRVLHRLRRAVRHSEYRERIDRHLLLSIARSGVADEKALCAVRELERSHCDDALLDEMKRNLEEFERRLDAKTPYFELLDRMRDRAFELRENALLLYFRENADLLRGKRVLHFAPERRLSRWLRRSTQDLGMDYVTADPFLKGVDRREDLAALSFAGESADFVICHHVLDLVRDDIGAMKEIFRVLKPGGTLQASCYESLHNESVCDWLAADASLHGYIRHYGRDFPARLAQAGFEVTLVRRFLDMTPEEHARNATLPLRLFHCRKPEKESQ